MMIKVLTQGSFDVEAHGADSQAVADYLTSLIDKNDPAQLAAALGDIARARGMAEVAKAAGLGREALYRALQPGTQPRFDTVQRVCIALGVKLTAVPT